jgi:hypothetical protein
VRRAAADGIAALRRTYPAVADHEGIADGAARSRASRKRRPSGARTGTTGVSR